MHFLPPTAVFLSASLNACVVLLADYNLNGLSSKAFYSVMIHQQMPDWYSKCRSKLKKTVDASIIRF